MQRQRRYKDRQMKELEREREREEERARPKKVSEGCNRIGSTNLNEFKLLQSYGMSWSALAPFKVNLTPNFYFVNCQS